jgi:hypothetical protein
MLFRLLAAVAAAGLAFPATAKGTQSFRVDYTVSILGLNIGQSTFESTIGPRRFAVSGSAASSGIARIFDDTKATAKVTGDLAADGARARSFLLRYTSGDKTKRTELTFSGGRVTRTDNQPPTKPDGKTWVPVRPADLVAVADPLSLTMVTAPGLKQVCDRTLKMFDGELRADLRLSYVGLAPAETRGFSGESVTCSARFVPISGYKGGHRSIEFLKNKSKILISFAPLGTTGVYAPIKVSATTEIGTLVIDARRFETVSQ